jgi:hypothetical protein
MAAGSKVPVGHVGSNDAPEGGPAGGVDQLIAAGGISLSPPSGLGTVTVSAAAVVAAAAAAAASAAAASAAASTAQTTANNAATAAAAAAAAAASKVASVQQGVGIIVDATDPQNPIVKLAAAPDAIIQLMTKTGTVLSAIGAARFTYPADETPAAFVTNNVIPLRWAAPFNHYMNLYGIFLSPDPAPTDVVVTLQKNGVDTACTFTIPAGSPVGFVNADLLHSITYAAGDDWGLRMDVPAAGLEGPTQYTVGITILIVQT